MGIQARRHLGEDEAEEAKAAGAGVGQPKRSKDREILGKGLPDVTGSFINNFRYKNFDLTVDLQFVLGVDVYQQFLHSTEDRFELPMLCPLSFLKDGLRQTRIR